MVIVNSKTRSKTSPHLATGIRFAQDVLLAKVAVGRQYDDVEHVGGPGQEHRQARRVWGLQQVQS